MRLRTVVGVLVIAALLQAAQAQQEAAQPIQPQTSTSKTQARPALADAPPVEKETLERLLNDSSWPRRAIAAVRLERYGCQPSQRKLIALLDDQSWQARGFAVRSLARRGVPADETWFADESEPRVLRNVLRHRYAIDPARLQRGVRILAKSNDLNDKMIAAELGAASSDPDLNDLAIQTVKRIILRMDRAEAGRSEE